MLCTAMGDSSLAIPLQLIYNRYLVHADGIGRINCTDSSGKARFGTNGGTVVGGGVSETINRPTAALVVNPFDVANFQNRDLYCNDVNTTFYLYISSASKYA